MESFYHCDEFVLRLTTLHVRACELPNNAPQPDVVFGVGIWSLNTSIPAQFPCLRIGDGSANRRWPRDPPQVLGAGAIVIVRPFR